MLAEVQNREALISRRRRMHEPVRRCIVTRMTRPKAGLIRFVVGPAGTLIPDLEEKLPGRGLWLTARKDILATAVSKGAFSKAARRPVAVPQGLAEEIERQLVRRCLGYLGFARRAGEAVFGAVRVKDWLDSGQAAVVIEALDERTANAEEPSARFRVKDDVARVVCLRADELGAASGRERVTHMALSAGGLAEKFLAEAARLAGFRDGAEARIAEHD